MKIQINTLNSRNQTFINSILNRGISRSKVTSIAIAKALSQTYALSPSDVNIDEYFEMTFKINASVILNDINETMLINIDQTLHYLLKFLKFRYYALCGSQYTHDVPPIIITRENALFDLLGVSRVFSVEDEIFVKDEFYLLGELVEGFDSLLKEINAGDN